MINSESNIFSPVAVKYNGNLLDNHPCIASYDYMVINCQGVPNLTSTADNLVVEKADYGTSIFKDLATITIDGVKFCSMVWNPRNPKLGKNLVQVKLENHVLYLLPLPEIKKVLDAFFDHIDLQVKNISRLDVCADFENSNQVFENVVRAIATEQIRVSGRPKEAKQFGEVGFYGQTSKGNLSYQGISIGKKSSTRYLRIYNKSVEMEKVKYKEHIVKYWADHGIRNNNVWRFEYALNNAFLKQYKATYDEIFDPEYIVLLLEKAMDGHFDLKYNTGKKEVNKEKSVPLFSFDKLMKVKKKLFKCVKYIDETIQRSITSVKRQIKGLYRSYYSSGSDSFWHALNVHLDNYELWGWFDQKQDEYLKEFRKQAIKLQL
ncbi:phage/plasmid replication domain-containing protein [Zhouia amylolytica]|uniref:phage/plasmid replication domain-containing protein n=1 Tax=Zhouia amylolytica TaxID=376730 RepID=UPI0020CEF801|nr:phage/plasmid replication protein [Zhouia amylolytica]MCQ0113030.1 hypothetical protein [Zhouia amylolytica]